MYRTPDGVRTVLIVLLLVFLLTVRRAGTGFLLGFAREGRDERRRLRPNGLMRRRAPIGIGATSTKNEGAFLLVLPLRSQPGCCEVARRYISVQRTG
jgi:hypothetical protein